MELNAIARSGFQAAQTRASVAAANIANDSTPGYQALEAVQSSSADGGVVLNIRQRNYPPDMVREIMDLKAAQRQAQTCIALVKSQDEMTGTLLKMLA